MSCACSSRAAELKLMQRAADISVAAHQAAMRAAKAGVREYELQAEIERVFRMHDAVPAYGSIVGAGANACVLHYVANTAQSQDGDLVLVDAGAEYRNYASDITRTFPVNGRFSKEQRALHDLVGAAQAAALAQAKPGVAYEAGHNAAVQHADRRPAQARPAQGHAREEHRRRQLQALLPAQDRALDRAGRA